MSEYTVQYDDEFEQYYVSNEFKRLLGSTEVCTLLNEQVKRIAALEKERDIRDLKQQAMGIEDVVNECAHSMEAIQVYVADLDCRVADLREQAKALKEQGE